MLRNVSFIFQNNIEYNENRFYKKSFVLILKRLNKTLICKLAQNIVHAISVHAIPKNNFQKVFVSKKNTWVIIH